MTSTWRFVVSPRPAAPVVNRAIRPWSYSTVCAARLCLRRLFEFAVQVRHAQCTLLAHRTQPPSAGDSLTDVSLHVPFVLTRHVERMKIPCPSAIAGAIPSDRIGQQAAKWHRSPAQSRNHAREVRSPERAFLRECVGQAVDQSRQSRSGPPSRRCRFARRTSMFMLSTNAENAIAA